MDSYDEMEVSSDRDNSVDTVDSCLLEDRQYRQILSAKRHTLGASDNNNRPQNLADIPRLLKNEMPLPHHFPSPFFNNNNHHHHILTLSPIQSPSSTPYHATMMHASESWYHNNWHNDNYNAAHTRLPPNQTTHSAVKRNKDGSQKFDEDWGPTMSQYCNEEDDKKETEINLKKKRVVQ